MHHSPRRWIPVAAVAGAVIATAAGCGKKGPPLAPYVHIPAAVERVTAHRVGDDVYLSLTVPTTNVDASTPVDISRVEIYGYTGRVAPSKATFADLATLVATIPIVPPPPPAPASGSTRNTARPAAAAGAGSGGAPVDPDAARVGSIVIVRDVLTPEVMRQGRTAPVPPRVARGVAPTPAPTGPLLRFYMAIAFSPRGRPGPPGGSAEIALFPLPAAPADVRATYTAAELKLAWEPSAGTLGYLMDQYELPPESPPLDDYDERASPVVGHSDEPPPGPTRYNIYRVLEADPLAPPPVTATSTWNAPPPVPLNAAPLAALTSTDAVLFDRRVCYTVRAVRGSGPRAVESEPSDALCMTAIDVFPPSPPHSLAAVAGGQAISLIWEPNDEPEVAGYLVLRGVSADATLQTLTPSPITATRYRDESVTPGVTYVYAVVAVDGRVPLPNVSAESNRVEETAR